MKKKEVKFDEIKVGCCFKYYGMVYRKSGTFEAFPITKKK